MSLLFFLAAAAAPQPSELKTFGDWTVGCDNGLACHATSLHPENSEWEGRGAIAVTREPEPDAQPSISLFTNEEKAALRVDGRPLRVRLATNESGVAVAAADVPAALAALRTSRELDVRAAEGGGRVSLRGLSAALLYMDDRQKRIGTVTALVKRGPRLASAVPAPPPLPEVVELKSLGTRKAALPAKRLAELRASGDCNDDAPREVTSVALDARTTLTLVPCWLGPYNSTSLVLVAQREDGSDLRPARFDFNASAGEVTGADVPPGGAYWDEEAGRLSSYFKGRGLGDCGSMQEWAWDGTMFRLIRAQTMGECRGSTDYITTWRAKAVRR